jgi:predicted HTH transcriptional regulator
VFDVVDKAVDFVMSRIDVHVGTRAYSTTVDVTCEIPREAVTEAIVNAVIHRDYRSNASVQVMLFKDRLEVWNPGQLPYGLSPEKLQYAHSSMPVNPILAHPAYLAGYIEEMGTGTSDIIDKCLDAGLDMPEFVQAESFKVVIWREKNVDQGELQVNESGADEELYRWEIRQRQIKQQKALCANKAKRGNHPSVIEKQQMVVDFCTKPRTSIEIMEHIGVTRQTRTVNLYIGDLIKAGKLRPLVPEKPNSPRQRYISVR